MRASSAFAVSTRFIRAQLPVIEEVFRPSAAEIAAARRVISDSEHQARIGRGAWQSEGRTVDAAVVVRAQETLRWAGEDAPPGN